jgi:hypothetical protein
MPYWHGHDNSTGHRFRCRIVDVAETQGARRRRLTVIRDLIRVNLELEGYQVV